jgi:hypothetical protein
MSLDRMDEFADDRQRTAGLLCPRMNPAACPLTTRSVLQALERFRPPAALGGFGGRTNRPRATAAAGHEVQA